MSTPPQQRPGPRESRARIPIAYPPRAPSPVAAPALAPYPVSSPTPANLWTLAALKSWSGSLGLHAAMLLVLAFWYFTPPNRRPIEFDTRLGGSPNGVMGGSTILGGLNAVEDEIGMSDAELAPSPEPLLDVTPANLEPLATKARGARPSAGGGVANDNPGAGDGGGFGLARFGDGSENIRGIQVKVGDPQFTLIWDTDVDLDLHVIEPGGKEISWEERKGDQGGELDVDNTRGYGPENIFWLVETKGPAGDKVKGDGPPGTYRWFVAYYGGFGGIAKPTQWQVRIKHAGRVTVQRGKLRSLDEKSKTFSLTVGPKVAGGSADDEPLLPPERP